MDKKTLYLECYSGISGDMTVAALLDLGANEEALKKALDSLNINGYKIKISRTKKCGIDACDFDVMLEHSHGHEREHNHDEADDHEHNHDRAHNHNHAHVHRNLNDILEIIEKAKITDRAKSISKKIFNIIAVSEAKAHGTDIEKVHFHEVGAVDSIVDIVATAVCIDDLNIHKVIVSELYEGRGHVECQHGTMPVPVPAVVNIIMDNSIDIKITDIQGEMVTPTGAAIVAALKTENSLPSCYKIKGIGIGAGKRDFPRANILRAYIIEENVKKKMKYGY